MTKQLLKENIRVALSNENLQGAMGRFADSYVDSREKAYEGKDFESIRQQIAQIKRDAAARMEELAAQFTREAEKRGAKVYRAATARDALLYISELAQSRGIKTIVKSKSMASEEIHLNEYLLEQGLDPVETDLGEWILQLCGQRPSHMVMPAIHMTRGEVAEVFSGELNKKIDADIPVLVKVAREQLRKKFLTAGMGISGANIGVAESGTVVIVTNEGNARLTSSLPPVHVVIMGLEKLVPKFKDIGPILEALPKSATGQKITSYITMITGAPPAVDAQGNHLEHKEQHIILLDNGRTIMRDDPVFKEALQCIRCASCLNVCPVFRHVGGHVYGDVYTGGIGTVLTAFFNSFEKAGEIQNLCLRCERCKQFCPGKVNLPRLLLELRTRVVAKEGLPAGQQLAFNKVLTNRKLFHTLLKAASKIQKPFIVGGKVRHLPMFLAGLTEGRSLPAIAEKPFRDGVGNIPVLVKKPRAKVGFFGGCLVDFVYPHIGEAVYKVLESMNIDIFYPKDQSCCGLPAIQTGLPSSAWSLAKINIEAFEEEQVDYVITPCPTCTYTLKHHYPELLAGDPAWRERVNAFAEKVIDFSSFVSMLLDEGVELPLKALNGNVTYHDSCHLRRSLGVYREPRQLIQKTGLKLVEMDGADQCCGFAGSYSVKFPELSMPILGRKLSNIEAAKVDLVALDCPGCLLQISGGLEQKNCQTEVRHTAEILAGALRKLD